MHRSNFICFKLSKTLIVLLLIMLIQTIFIIIGIKDLIENSNLEQMQTDALKMQDDLQEKQKIKVQNQENLNQNITKNENQKNSNINNSYNSKTSKSEEQKLEEYKNMPKELKGYKVIGKIEIPKLKLNTYILNETNKKALKVSVTKLYGPDINKVGNFCIAGHNYRNNKMFGGIKKLVEGDEIILTDTFDRNIKYRVYKSYQTDPKDVSSLGQGTGGEREVTLITCTAGAIKRVIVKAIEEYD